MVFKKAEVSNEMDIGEGRHTIVGKCEGVGRGTNARTRNIVVGEGIHLASVTRSGKSDDKPNAGNANRIPPGVKLENPKSR